MCECIVNAVGSAQCDLSKKHTATCHICQSTAHTRSNSQARLTDQKTHDKLGVLQVLLFILLINDQRFLDMALLSSGNIALSILAWAC